MEPTSNQRPQSTPATPPAILALDNVRLELALAGLGSRALAALVDYLLLSLLVLTWWLTGFVLALATGMGDGWLWALVLLGAFLIQWGYFAVLEIVMDGQTLGKRAVGLRVVSRHGGAAGAGAIVIRNLVRTIDLLLVVPMLILDRQSRRLGDMLAGTLVIHQQGGGDELRLGRLPRGWGAPQAAVAESFLRRAAELEPRHAETLARRLLGAVVRDDPELAGDVAPGADPVVTLRRLLAVTES